MKDVVRSARLAYLFIAAGLAGVTQPATADSVGECRQEAELYGVPPEQFEDYLHGCVMSRGGYPSDAGSQGELAPPVEGAIVTSEPDDVTTQENSGVEDYPDGTQ
jgi:hypothetical protein